MRLQLPARKTVAVITTAADERPVKRAAKSAGAVAVHVALTSVAGWVSFAHRANDAMTHGAIRWEIRHARASEDHDRLEKWVHALEDAKVKRAERLAALPREIMNGAVVAVLGILAVLAVLGTLGLVAQSIPGGMGFTDVFRAVGDVIGGTVGIVKFLVGIALFPLVAPVLLAALGYFEGRSARATGAAMGVKAVVSTATGSVDESTIAKALVATGIAPLTKALKDSPELEFVVMPASVGRGRHATLALPAGVPAADVIRRKPKLAAALRRSVLEIDARVGEHAGELDLWVANPGALAAGPGPHPYTTEKAPHVDFFQGVPLGVNARGDIVYAPLFGKNYLIGGAPAQGKSTAAITIVTGAALDPTVKLWIYVCAENGDFDALRKRSERFTVGAKDTIDHLVDGLSDLKAILEVRGSLLKKHGVRQVNRELANTVEELRPLIVLIEEAQVGFRDETHGEQLDKDITDLVELCRKCGVMLIVSTQAPTAKSIPTSYKRQATVRLAFHVSDIHANDAILGDGAYSAPNGNATELRAGKDRGTCIAAGLDGEDKYQLVQVFYLNEPDLGEVLAKCPPLPDLVKPGGGAAVPEPAVKWADEPAETVTEPAPVYAPNPDWEHVEFLGTVLRVMGSCEELRTTAVAKLWAEHGHGEVTGTALQRQLEAAGVKVAAPGNKPVIRTADVEARLPALDGGQRELDDIARAALEDATRVIEVPVGEVYRREEAPMMRIVR